MLSLVQLKGRKKMKKYSRIIILLTVFTIMIVGTGCMFREDPYKKILKYLQEKYDNDTFTDARPCGGQPFGGGPVYEIECTSKLHPEFPIIGAYDEKSDTFFDNYMSVVYAEQFDEYVEETILDELFGKGNYYYFSYYDNDRTRSSGNFYKDMTFEEFIKDMHGLMLDAVVDVSCLGDKEDLIDKLNARMEESGIDYKWVDFYFVEVPDTIKLDGYKQITSLKREWVEYLKGKRKDGKFEYTWEK